MSPASGDRTELDPNYQAQILIVSIQLMSPASGDYEQGHMDANAAAGFHSINVPSEWGLGKDREIMQLLKSFHSINVPSEWGPRLLDEISHFGNTGFPFN